MNAVAIYDGVKQARRVEVGSHVVTRRASRHGNVPAGTFGTVVDSPAWSTEGRFTVEFQVDDQTYRAQYDRLTYSALVHADGTPVWPPLGTSR